MGVGRPSGPLSSLGCDLLTAQTPAPIWQLVLRSNRIACFRRSEEVMGHRPFSKPVFLKLHRTGNFQARSAWEALEYLDLHWPEARTAHYRQARTLCQSAVDGFIDAEAARNAVIDAAQRAGLLANGWDV